MNPVLSAYTTFRLGGACRDLSTVATAAEAAERIREWNAAGIPWRVMGGGSNLLVADRGLDEAVLRVASPRPDCLLDDGCICASGGTALDEVSRFAVDEGLSGVGFASGIPGRVGGAICGNAGAFGASVGDVLDRVEVVTRRGRKKILPGESLGFGYRQSLLQQTGDVVMRAWFRVRRDDRVRLLVEREDILEMRRTRHPDWRAVGTAGSCFKNLPPTERGGRRRAAGALLEAAGAKAMREGGAYVFHRHANIVLAEEGASARDVANLLRRMADAVRQRFDVALEPEVRFWGKLGGAAPSAGG